MNRGVNLGGWISQYDEFSTNHFDLFITEKDIAQIVTLGFDHVRVPVDYLVLEDDAYPMEYREEGFSYLDRCVEWTRKYNLGMIIDLHSAPGFCFHSPDKTTLFTDVNQQERFLSLWKFIAKRYRGEKDDVVLELLNEIVLSDSAPWNEFAARIVKSIRSEDKTRKIIVGGNNYNSVQTLNDITILDDEHIIYTFHFYEPMLFTHQKAVWMPVLVAYGQELSWPGEFTGLKEFVSANMGDTGKFHDNVSFKRYIGKTMNRDLLIEELSPAIEFMKKNGKPLYCGEFGVIDKAPIPARVNWTVEIDAILEELGIGRAYWTYKNRDFGLVTKKGEVVDERLFSMFKK